MTEEEIQQLVLDRVDLLAKEIELANSPKEAISLFSSFGEWIERSLLDDYFADKKWLKEVLNPRLAAISKQSELLRYALTADKTDSN